MISALLFGRMQSSPLPTSIAVRHGSRKVSPIAASVVGALDELPDDQRAVFLLKEVAHLPLRDIAEVTDTTEHAVKTRLRYALDRLQRVLSGFEEYARALR